MYAEVRALGLRRIWSPRSCGWCFALALSIIGHGLVLFGLSTGFYLRKPSHGPSIHAEFFAGTQSGSVPLSLRIVEDVPEQGLLETVKQIIEPELLPKRESESRQRHGIGAERNELTERVPLRESLTPEKEQSGSICPNQGSGGIPDVGRSNRVGRRIQEDPCDQG